MERIQKFTMHVVPVKTIAKTVKQQNEILQLKNAPGTMPMEHRVDLAKQRRKNGEQKIMEACICSRLECGRSI
ncbi:hypothetical protein LQZ18_12960 [Lachnospiraceae bacterium ZAX-1]